MGEAKKKSGFWTTKQICKRYLICSRTLARWRDSALYQHPFPEPAMAANGSQNRWRIDDVIAWEEEGALGARIKNQEAA